MELEEEGHRSPLAENIEPLVHATYLLMLLGEADALVEFPALRTHRDSRVRELAARHVEGYASLLHDHGPGPREWLSERRLSEIQIYLLDKAVNMRGLGLELGLRDPDVRLAPLVASILHGRSVELVEAAAKLFRMCHTLDEQTLAAVRPGMEKVIPLVEIPPEASDKDREELKKDNADRAARQYKIRRYAAHALMYPHGSRNIQEYLLAYFADPERQLKRELNVALQYCPDLESVQAALLGMVDGAEPLRTSALFALSHFKNPLHRELFLGNLQSENVETAKAALRGIQPHMQANDVAALQECRERWR